MLDKEVVYYMLEPVGDLTSNRKLLGSKHCSQLRLNESRV